VSGGDSGYVGQKITILEKGLEIAFNFRVQGVLS